jgi:hypothetical protein
MLPILTFVAWTLDTFVGLSNELSYPTEEDDDDDDDDDIGSFIPIAPSIHLLSVDIR